MEKINKIYKSFEESEKKGLFIFGKPGVGKTYTLEKFIENYNKPKMYPTTDGKQIEIAKNYKMKNLSDVFSDLVGAQQSGGYTGKLNDLKKSEMLFLDDMGTEKSSDFRNEVLYQIIDYRYRNELPTFITSNLTTKEVAEKYSTRLASRIIDMCMIVEMTGKDRRIGNRIDLKI